jgi:hypothetical protein
VRFLRSLKEHSQTIDAFAKLQDWGLISQGDGKKILYTSKTKGLKKFLDGKNE